MKNLIYITLISVLQVGCVSVQSTKNVEHPELDFEIHNNILIVEGFINKKWAKFVVDTGASISLLDYKQSKKYKFNYFLDDKSTRLTGFGGRSKLMKASEVSFNLTGESDKSSRFFASDLSDLNVILGYSNQKILGILGSDFLQAYGAIIDYQHSRIVLTQPL